MIFHSSMARNSFRVLLALTATLISTSCLSFAKGKPPKDDSGGGFIFLSVTFEDDIIDLYEVGRDEFVSPSITSDGQGSYVDGVDDVVAITGDGYRLDTEIERAGKNPPVRFLSFDLDGDGRGDVLATVDMRLDRKYYADANGDLNDANGNPVTVANRVTENYRMVPKDMSPNSVARAALFVRFDTVETDGTVRHWRFVYGDSQPDSSMPDAIPVWIFAGEDNGRDAPLDWRIVGTTGALFELVPENPNKKNSALISEFSGYLDLPVHMLLERHP